MKTLAAILAAALSIGTASAQYSTGQALIVSAAIPRRSPPVTGYATPYIPAEPQPQFTLAPTYAAPGAVNPYSSPIR